MVPLFFFLIFDGSIVTLGYTNITYDCTFATFGCTLIFLLTFDSFIVILSSTNITYGRSQANQPNDLIINEYI